MGAYRGKTVHVFGTLATHDADGAGFWMRIDGQGGSKGTRDWTPFSIVLQVPQGAASAALGLILEGNGDVRGSNLQIEVVPNATPVTAQ